MARHPISPLPGAGLASRLRRPQAVSLEIPVALQGLAGSSELPESGPACPSFYEESHTQLVFPRGAVVRVSANVQPGQHVLLKNRCRGKEILCRAVFSKNFVHTKGFVELEFTQPVSGFWGIYFPDEPIGPSAAGDPAPAPAPKPVEKPAALPPRPVADVPPVPVVSAPSVPSAEPRATVGLAKPESLATQPVVALPDFVATLPLADAIDSVIERHLATGKTPAVPLPVTQARSTAASLPLPEVPRIAVDSAAAFETPVPAAAIAPAPPMAQFAPASLFEEQRPRRRMPLLAGVACALLIGGVGIFSFMAMRGGAKRDLPQEPAAASLSAPSTTTQPASAAAALGPAEVTAEAQIPAKLQVGVAASSALRELSTSDASPAASPAVSPSKDTESVPRPQKLVLQLHAVPIPHASAQQESLEAPPEIAGALAATPEGVSSKLGELGLNAPHVAPPPVPAPEPKEAPAPGGKVELPRLLASVRPVYPLLALRSRIQGDVVIRALIDETGKVSEMQIVAGPAQLQSAAKDALQQWKYAPAKLNGQPIAMELLVTIRFQLP